MTLKRASGSTGRFGSGGGLTGAIGDTGMVWVGDSSSIISGSIDSFSEVSVGWSAGSKNELVVLVVIGWHAVGCQAGAEVLGLRSRQLKQIVGTISELPEFHAESCCGGTQNPLGGLTNDWPNHASQHCLHQKFRGGHQILIKKVSPFSYCRTVYGERR